MDFCWQQMRDQHFSRLSSALPVASSQRTASTKKKKVEFFCANTQYYCEMNPLYFYFLSLSRVFFPPWRMCCSFTWNEACTNPSFFLGFFGSYSFKNDCSGDWGAALKECCCLFLWRQLPRRVLKFFFKAFCWQGMQKILNLLNSVFSVLSSVVSPEGGSTVCSPQSLFQVVFHLGWRGVCLNSWEAVAKPSRLGEVSLLFSKIAWALLMSGGNVI